MGCFASIWSVCCLTVPRGLHTDPPMTVQPIIDMTWQLKMHLWQLAGPDSPTLPAALQPSWQVLIMQAVRWCRMEGRSN